MSSSPAFRERVRELVHAEPPSTYEGPEGGAPAAVIVPVIDGASDPSLLFTKRTDAMRRHPGEISFPGGMQHADDDDLLQTALRETEEELGIPASAFDVLGYLDPLHTYVTGILITPAVAAMSTRPELRPNPDEIAEVLEFPLHRLAEVEREVEYRHDDGSVWMGHVYELDGHTIWGATGKILHRFLELTLPAREGAT